MTDVVQLVSIVVSAALLVTVIELVRRGRLTEEYSFIWIGLGRRAAAAYRCGEICSTSRPRRSAFTIRRQSCSWS